MEAVTTVKVIFTLSAFYTNACVLEKDRTNTESCGSPCFITSQESVNVTL
jgi:hypothetical protein